VTRNPLTDGEFECPESLRIRQRPDFLNLKTVCESVALDIYLFAK
jgi:hypothetical protein